MPNFILPTINTSNLHYFTTCPFLECLNEHADEFSKSMYTTKQVDITKNKNKDIA